MTSTPAPSQVTLVQLQCFLAVVDLGSFAAAGRHLGMSTSAVSKVISRLEKARSVRLLNRSTHALSLTQEGERLLPLVREALGHLDGVESAMNDVAGGIGSGKVRISAPTTFLACCLVPLAARFQAEHPDIVLELRGSDAMDDLAEEGLDLALRTGKIVGVPGHLRQSWFHFPWVTCAAPAYLKAHGTPSCVRELGEHRLIGFRNRGTGLIEPWRYCASNSTDKSAIRFDPSVSLVMDDGNGIRAAGVAGLGIHWSPSWMVADELRTGRLQAILTDLSPRVMEFSIIRRAQVYTPERTALVISFLQRYAKSLDWGRVNIGAPLRGV